MYNYIFESCPTNIIDGCRPQYGAPLRALRNPRRPLRHARLQRVPRALLHARLRRRPLAQRRPPASLLLRPRRALRRRRRLRPARLPPHNLRRLHVQQPARVRPAAAHARPRADLNLAAVPGDLLPGADDSQRRNSAGDARYPNARACRRYRGCDRHRVGPAH